MKQNHFMPDVIHNQEENHSNITIWLIGNRRD